jgi:hypothetical protein
MLSGIAGRDRWRHLITSETDITAPAFIADPAIRFLGALTCPLALFRDIPAHAEHRQTALHAAVLLRSGVLNHPIDIHRHVAMQIIANDLDALERAFSASPQKTIARALAADDASKTNGHTRAELWHHRLIPVPADVFLHVWGIQRHSDGATRLYKAFRTYAGFSSIHFDRG